MDLIKALLCFSAGVVAGSAVTYFLTKEHIQEKADEETEAFMEHYNKKLKSLENKNTEEVEEHGDDPEPDEEVIEEYVKQTIKYGEENYTDYTSAYSRESSNKEAAYDGVDLIDKDIFDIDGTYNKEILYYYDVNDVLTTSDDTYIPVEEVKDYVGAVGIRELTGGNREIIYLRNAIKETDYKIQRLFTSYEDMS